MKIRLILPIIALTLASISGLQAMQQGQAKLETKAPIQKKFSILGYALKRGAKLVFHPAADVNYRDENQDTTLHLVLISRDHIPFNDIELLLKKGANINAQNIYGQTPLMLFLERKWVGPRPPALEYLKLVKLFLGRGLTKELAETSTFKLLPADLHGYIRQYGVKPLDLSLTDNEGKSTLDYAKETQAKYRQLAEGNTPEQKGYQEDLLAFNEIVRLLEEAQKK